MNKLDAVKNIAKIAVSIGVGAVVGNAVKCTTPEDTKGIGKILVALGSLVVANMISDKAADYTEEKIDETINDVKEALAEVEVETEVKKEEN